MLEWLKSLSLLRWSVLASWTGKLDLIVVQSWMWSKALWSRQNLLCSLSTIITAAGRIISSWSRAMWFSGSEFTHNLEGELMRQWFLQYYKGTRSDEQASCDGIRAAVVTHEHPVVIMTWLDHGFWSQLHACRVFWLWCYHRDNKSNFVSVVSVYQIHRNRRQSQIVYTTTHINSC